MKRLPFAVILLTASPALAYVRSTNSSGTPTRWRSNEIHLEDPMVAPSGMTTADADAAIARAAAAWSAPPCTGLRLMTSSWMGTPAEVANDMHPTIVVRKDRWCNGTNCYDPQQLAITTVFARAADGEIVDADIELNAVNFQWTNIPDSGVNPQPGAADLANVLTHELGHLLGLADNCVTNSGPPAPLDDTGAPAPLCSAAPAALHDATMFPDTVADDIRKRTLADDDVRAICAIYPHMDLPADAGAPDAESRPFDAGITISLSDGSPLAPPMSTSSSKGGCQLGGGAPPGWMALAAAALALVRRRRRGSR